MLLPPSRLPTRCTICRANGPTTSMIATQGARIWCARWPGPLPAEPCLDAAQRGKRRCSQGGRLLHRFLAFGVHSWAAVAFLDLVMDGLNLAGQDLAALLPCTGGAMPPGVVAAGGHLQHLAHQPHRPRATIFVHEAGSPSDSLAKKAGAFF